MACDFPQKAFRSLVLNPETGKRPMTFNPLKAANSDNPVILPCGKCMGCRLERSRQWAVRINHEAQLYAENSFVTLTYEDKNLPADYGLDLRELQLFLKRLRFELSPKKIRFYACGEYGEETLRPHYHLIIFNHHFTQKTVYSIKRGHRLYTSPQLTSLWPHGLATFGTVTFESAAYVARYVTKKITGDMAQLHYCRIHPVTGNICNVKPEFSVMSRRPGIGGGWYKKFKSDVYPSDFIVHNGHKLRPPRFYDKQLTEKELHIYKLRRKAASLIFKPHTTSERLKARAAVRDARMKTVKRGL